MLIQFNFENYKSYFDETSLNLSSTAISEYKSCLIDYRKEESFLRVASIYGANASGKSNILDAFDFMRFWVSKSFQRSEEHQYIPVKKFQFSTKGKKKPSLFEVFFSVDDKEYQYGFSLDHSSVHSEWLYKRNFKFKSKYELVFERDGQVFNLCDSLKSKNEIISSMNDKTLLCTFLSRIQNPESIDVLNWFKTTHVVNFGDTTFEYLITKSLPKSRF